jgi:hypothetical protein
MPSGLIRKPAGESAESGGGGTQPAHRTESASSPRARGRRVLAQVTDYAGLITALRARVDELNLTFDTLDEVAGLSDRYSSKLLTPAIKPSRTLGKMSLGAVLGALGLRLIVVEDPVALAKVQNRYRPRKYARPSSWRARVPVGKVWTTPVIQEVSSNPDT